MESPFLPLPDSEIENSNEYNEVIDEVLRESPLIDPSYHAHEFSGEHSEQFNRDIYADSNESKPDNLVDNLIEGELSATELSTAVRLNKDYAVKYRWGSYTTPIINLIAGPIAPGDTRTVAKLSDPNEFAKALDRWQEKQGFKTSSRGVLGLSTWSYIQRLLAMHQLKDTNEINLEKAISQNKKYAGLWGSSTDKILNYFSRLGITKDGLPLDDKYFALAITAWQKKVFTDKKDIDGILGPGSFAKMKPQLLVSTPVTPVRSRWHSVIKDTVQCAAEPMVGGNETLRNIVEAIRTANAPGHYIYILGWMLDVDFCLVANDNRTKLTTLLKTAVDNGVEVRALIWGNPTYIPENNIARDTLNGFPISSKGGSARVILDNNTFGSEAVKNAIIRTKAIISGLPAPVPTILSQVNEWNEINSALNLVKNDGSHHEKVLIVKGAEGLIGFAGGIDINRNRVDGLKGSCCSSITPPDEYCGLDKDDSFRSTVLRDVSCKLRDEGAWKLLLQFIRRWDSYKSIPQPIPDPYLFMALKGVTEPRPNNPVGATSSSVKVLHTYNHPTNPAIKDRSIRETLKAAIENASKKIYFEDQYMVSCEIADWLNARLKDDKFEKLTIVTQHDKFTSELIFPNKMRNAFLRRLYKGISQDVQDRKVSVSILDPNAPAPLHRRMHSKMYIIDDDLAIIGSPNCSNRSMYHDSETAVVIFNDDPSKKDFVKELNTKLTTNETVPKPKYDPVATVKDLDERIIVGVRNWIAKADWKTKLALQITNLNQIPPVIISLVKSIRPLLVQIVEPHSNCGVFDVGADYEMENFYNEELTPETNPDHFHSDSETADYETILESPELHGEFAFNNENNNTMSPYESANERNEFTDDRELEIAEVIEHQAAIVSKPSVKACETRTCWAKSVLNRELGLSLPEVDTLDEPTKKALADFQQKNNLIQTGKIDFATERALLEADALQRTRGTVQAAAALATINTAKTKIEDWTTKAVNNKPKLVLNSYRDPRKLRAFVLHHMAFKRKSRKTNQYSDPNSYLSTGAHFCIMFDGRIIQLHPLSRMIWHADCTSPLSVSVEFEGNFPNIKGGWWIDKDSKYPDKDVPTQAQYEAGRFLAGYLKIVLNLRHILAHRQSSHSRENDPGPDIWYNVGQWAVDNLGVEDGGPGFKCGTGNPILPEWRTWGNKNKPVIKKEYSELEEEGQRDHDETEFSYEEGEFEAENEWNNEESFVPDWSNSVRLNRYFAEKIGWEKYRDRINDLLLPFSGQQNVSLGEEDFARAVAAWQNSNGFTGKNADGVIGPTAWSVMNRILNPGTSSPPPPVKSPSGNQIIDGVRFAQKNNGWAAYGGGDLKTRLQELNQKGLLNLSANEIEMFRLVSIPESGGLVNAINSWDSAYMSMGFLQFTIQHTKLQEVIRKAPDAFKKHGIELDFSRSYQGDSRITAIKNAPDIADLRRLDWAVKFFRAGLENEAIVAQIQVGREILNDIRKRFDPAGYLNRFNNLHPNLWAFIYEADNSRPAILHTALRTATQKAGSSNLNDALQFGQLLLDELKKATYNYYNNPKIKFSSEAARQARIKEELAKVGRIVSKTGIPVINKETITGELEYEQFDEQEFRDESEFSGAMEEAESMDRNNEEETQFYEPQQFSSETLMDQESQGRTTGSSRPQAYLTIRGQKQGQIMGDVKLKGREGSIAVNELSYEINSPHDANSGLSVGRRQHKPLKITKEVDTTSTKLLKAAVTNEILTQVVINFWKTAGDGTEINCYRVTLTNASITQIKQNLPIDFSTSRGQAKFTIFERVEFTYQNIEWEWLDKERSSAMDSWGSPD